MELDVFKVLLCHRQYIARIGQEHIPALNILGHILVLAFLEAVEFLFVICLYPACLVQVYGFPSALRIVLVLQTILDNLKLQLAYRTHDATAVELIDEQLGHALVHQLLQSFLELFALHGVIVLNILEKKR